MLSITNFSFLTTVVLTGFIHGQSIIDGPDDATGLIGGTAQFHCKVEFGVLQEMTWEFNDEIIYSFSVVGTKYPMGSSKYLVIKESNSFTLHVHNLNYIDGGKYTCAAFLPTSHAVLVVLGKPSIMIHPSHPVEGQSVNLTCAAQFGGPDKDSISPKHYPELLMYLDGKLLDIPTSENQNQLSKTHSVRAATRMNGQNLSCQVRTTNPEMNTDSYHVKLEILSAEVEGTTKTVVFVVIGILVGLCLLGIAIFLYFKRKRKQNNKKKSPRNEGEDVPLRSEDVENQPEKVKASGHTKRLRDLISQSEYVSNAEKKFIWSKDLILKVKVLLQKGADPNWISSKEMQMENRGKNFTAQYNFFLGIVHILLSKGELFKLIKSLVPLFMSVKSNNLKFVRGNALHALVEIDWKWLSEKSIPKEFFQNYQDIILAVKKDGSSLINETDWNGRTPLHLLFQGFQLQEEWLEDFSQIVRHLRSNENIDIVDNTRRTALHYFTEAFSKFHKDLSLDGRRNFFLHIFSKLESDVNASSQDEDGHTVLHILARDILQHNRDFLFEVIKHLSNRKCDVDAKNKQGCTVLHILAEAYPTDGLENSAKRFIEVMKHLDEKSKGNIKDNEGNTVLHILAKKYIRNMSIGNHQIFYELIKALSEINCDVDIQDKGKCTVLHLLMDKYPKDVPEHAAEAFIELMKHLIQRSKGNSMDCEGYTLLHILANNYNDNLSVHYYSTVFELLKVFTSKINSRLLDRKKCTVLHILASKCSWITSEAIINKYYDIMICLLDEASKDIQNAEGCTILHILIRNYNIKAPAHCHKIFENLTKVLITKTNIIAQDRKGKTVLHTLVEKYPAEVSLTNTKAFLELVKHIAALSNRDIVDKDGCTVLHIFVKNYKQKNESHLKGTFLENVKMLKSGSNINIQDAHGQTPLHIVLMTMFYYQHFGQVLLPTIEILTSVDNVNMQDQLSITPFSWALQGIQETRHQEKKFKKMFEEIESIFISRGADRTLALNGCSVIQQHKNTLQPV